MSSSSPEPRGEDAASIEGGPRFCKAADSEAGSSSEHNLSEDPEGNLSAGSEASFENCEAELNHSEAGLLNRSEAGLSDATEGLEGQGQLLERAQLSEGGDFGAVEEKAEEEGGLLLRLRCENEVSPHTKKIRLHEVSSHRKTSRLNEVSPHRKTTRFNEVNPHRITPRLDLRSVHTRKPLD